MDSNRYRHTTYEPPGRAYGWRAWIAWLVLNVGCRHLKGTVCSHRQYLYDIWGSGSSAGYSSGVMHERGTRDHERAA